MPPPSTGQRLAALLQRGKLRKLVLVYDKRDQPPWTVELHVNGKLVALRSGASLQAAITAVQQADL